MKRKFTATDKSSARYTWLFWREGGYWRLQDFEGCVRTLEANWIDSAPRIRTILSNYDQSTNVILENLK